MPAQFRVATYKAVSYTAAAASSRVEVATGTFYYLSVGTAVVLNVWDASNRPIIDNVSLNAGRGIKLPPDVVGFKVEIKSAAAQAIVLEIIDGDIIDNSLILSALSTISTNVQPQGTLTDVNGTAVGAGACVAQANLPLDATRLVALVANPAASVNPIYVRGNNSAAVSAIKVEAGETAVITALSAIYVYNPGAVSITPLLQKITA